MAKSPGRLISDAGRLLDPSAPTQLPRMTMSPNTATGGLNNSIPLTPVQAEQPQGPNPHAIAAASGGNNAAAAMMAAMQGTPSSPVLGTGRGGLDVVLKKLFGNVGSA